MERVEKEKVRKILKEQGKKIKEKNSFKSKNLKYKKQIELMSNRVS